jgi:hypothetical protein
MALSARANSQVELSRNPRTDFERTLAKNASTVNNPVGSYLLALEKDDPEMLDFFLTEAK